MEANLNIYLISGGESSGCGIPVFSKICIIPNHLYRCTYKQVTLIRAHQHFLSLLTYQNSLRRFIGQSWKTADRVVPTVHRTGCSTTSGGKVKVEPLSRDPSLSSEDIPQSGYRRCIYNAPRPQNSSPQRDLDGDYWHTECRRRTILASKVSTFFLSASM